MSQSVIQTALAAVRGDIEIARKTRVNLMNAGQFEKDGAPNYVVRSNLVHAIAKTHYRKIRESEKKDILDACESLFESPPVETNIVAVDWAVRQRGNYNAPDLARFERWLENYVRGWGLCDAICCGPIGLLFHDFPELAPKTRKWLGAKSLWLRRAAAVSLIPSVRDGISFDLAKDISDRLLLDPEDYVQKGYGWLLKEASKKFQSEVFDFVLRRRDRMPRTALRYAIEKMPQVMRHEAMKTT